MIGILAYGSLIDNPGSEIESLIINRIGCITPFKVEYARSSKSRSGAPTLIPYESGRKVNAQILVLDTNDIDYVKTILWRRETHRTDNKVYVERKIESPNIVRIVMLQDFEGIDNVLYTSIGNNIDVNIDLLSDLAIKSIDGIKYLLDAKLNNIKTNLSDGYERAILEKTNTKTLLDAIRKLENNI